MSPDREALKPIWKFHSLCRNLDCLGLSQPLVIDHRCLNLAPWGISCILGLRKGLDTSVALQRQTRAVGVGTERVPAIAGQEFAE